MFECQVWYSCDPVSSSRSPSPFVSCPCSLESFGCCWRNPSVFFQWKSLYLVSNVAIAAVERGHATPGFLGHLGYHIGVIAAPFSCAYKYQRTHFFNKNTYVGYCNWSTYVHLQIKRQTFSQIKDFVQWAYGIFEVPHTACIVRIVVIWCQDTGLGRCCQRCEGHCCALIE